MFGQFGQRSMDDTPRPYPRFADDRFHIHRSVKPETTAALFKFLEEEGLRTSPSPELATYIIFGTGNRISITRGKKYHAASREGVLLELGVILVEGETVRARKDHRHRIVTASWILSGMSVLHQASAEIYGVYRDDPARRLSSRQPLPIERVRAPDHDDTPRRPSLADRLQIPAPSSAPPLPPASALEIPPHPDPIPQKNDSRVLIIREMVPSQFPYKIPRLRPSDSYSTPRLDPASQPSLNPAPRPTPSILSHTPAETSRTLELDGGAVHSDPPPDSSLSLSTRMGIVLPAPKTSFETLDSPVLETPYSMVCTPLIDPSQPPSSGPPRQQDQIAVDLQARNDPKTSVEATDKRRHRPSSSQGGRSDQPGPSSAAREVGISAPLEVKHEPAHPEDVIGIQDSQMQIQEPDVVQFGEAASRLHDKEVQSENVTDRRRSGLSIDRRPAGEMDDVAANEGTAEAGHQDAQLDVDKDSDMGMDMAMKDDERPPTPPLDDSLAAMLSPLDGLEDITGVLSGSAGDNPVQGSSVSTTEDTAGPEQQQRPSSQDSLLVSGPPFTSLSSTMVEDVMSPPTVSSTPNPNSVSHTSPSPSHNGPRSPPDRKRTRSPSLGPSSTVDSPKRTSRPLLAISRNDTRPLNNAVSKRQRLTSIPVIVPLSPSSSSVRSENRPEPRSVPRLPTPLSQGFHDPHSAISTLHDPVASYPTPPPSTRESVRGGSINSTTTSRHVLQDSFGIGIRERIYISASVSPLVTTVLRRDGIRPVRSVDEAYIVIVSAQPGETPSQRSRSQSDIDLIRAVHDRRWGVVVSQQWIEQCFAWQEEDENGDVSMDHTGRMVPVTDYIIRAVKCSEYFRTPGRSVEPPPLLGVAVRAERRERRERPLTPVSLATMPLVDGQSPRSAFCSGTTSEGSAKVEESDDVDRGEDVEMTTRDETLSNLPESKVDTDEHARHEPYQHESYDEEVDEGAEEESEYVDEDDEGEGEDDDDESEHHIPTRLISPISDTDSDRGRHRSYHDYHARETVKKDEQVEHVESGHGHIEDTRSDESTEHVAANEIDSATDPESSKRDDLKNVVTSGADVEDEVVDHDAERGSLRNDEDTYSDLAVLDEKDEETDEETVVDTESESESAGERDMANQLTETGNVISATETSHQLNDKEDEPPTSPPHLPPLKEGPPLATIPSDLEQHVDDNADETRELSVLTDITTSSSIPQHLASDPDGLLIPTSPSPSRPKRFYPYLPPKETVSLVDRTLFEKYVEHFKGWDAETGMKGGRLEFMKKMRTGVDEALPISAGWMWKQYRTEFERRVPALKKLAIEKKRGPRGHKKDAPNSTSTVAVTEAVTEADG